MKTLTQNLTLSALVATALMASALISSPAAQADGNIVCNSGDVSQWQNIKALKKQLWVAGWELQKIQIEGDCYEVYARLENGQAIEAFFHPVTLEKLAVYRRGSLIFKKADFKIDDRS